MGKQKSKYGIAEGDTVLINEEHRSWLGKVTGVVFDSAFVDFEVKLPEGGLGTRRVGYNPKYIVKATPEMIAVAKEEMEHFGEYDFICGLI